MEEERLAHQYDAYNKQWGFGVYPALRDEALGPCPWWISSTAATIFAPSPPIINRVAIALVDEGEHGQLHREERKREAMSEQEPRRLEALVARWQAEREDRAYRLKLETRFAKATTLDLMTMWATSTNETGKRLTTFEVEALVEAWLRVFGELPPTSKAAASREPVQN